MTTQDAKAVQKDKTAQDITRVAVIGAGVMGAGVAAQAANSGAHVLLLDRLPDDLPVDSGHGAGNKTARNSIAQGAIDRFNPCWFLRWFNASLGCGSYQGGQYRRRFR